MRIMCLSISLLFLTIICQSQTTVFDTISSGGLERNFRMYIPASYDGSESVPLIFNLHGYTSDNFGQAIYANFNPVADTAGFIIVLPNGTLDGLGNRYWNCFESGGTGVDDVQFISDLIDSISVEYNIDPNRIYSTGMSNGGFMSHTLACELSNKIAAIASVAGTIDKDRLDECDAQHNVPVMQIHGTADATVPYDDNLFYFSVDSVVHFWADHNGCNPVPEFYEVPDVITSDECTAEHYVHSGCFKNSNVELFKIIGGEHTWPGTAIIFLGVTNQDINACAEIWKFFSRYKLDELTGIESNPALQDDVLTVQPNPVSNDVTIQWNAVIKINSITVADYAGREIFHSGSFDSNKITIDTNNWANGIYILTITSEKEIISTQIIKN